MLRFGLGVAVGAVAMFSMYRFKIIPEYQRLLAGVKRDYERLWQRAKARGL